VNCFQDITERKAAEERLRAREEWYLDLLDALPAAIYTTDADGRITYYNQAAVELSGRRPVLGSDEWCVSWRLRSADGTPLRHEDCPMAMALKTGEPIRGTEKIAERPDGTRVPILPFPTPLRDASGALIGAVNMLLDISDRKRAEEQKNLLLRELAHRVNNTFAVILASPSKACARRRRRRPSPRASRRGYRRWRTLTACCSRKIGQAPTWRNWCAVRLRPSGPTPANGSRSKARRSRSSLRK
jgi:PAS domain-containing protein